MVVLTGQCLKQVIHLCPKRIQLHLAFSFVQCKALEVCHMLYVTHTKAQTQNTPKDVLGISLTHIKNFSGNSAKGMSPRFSFLLAIKPEPAGVVPSTGRQKLTECRARLSAGSKLLLRWALYWWAGERADLGMLTLKPHKGSNCPHLCQGTGNLHAFPLRI